MKIREILFKASEYQRKKGIQSDMAMIIDSVLISTKGCVTKGAIFRAIAKKVEFDLSDKAKQEYWKIIDRMYPFQISRYCGQIVLRGKKIRGSDDGYFKPGGYKAMIEARRRRSEERKKRGQIKRD